MPLDLYRNVPLRFKQLKLPPDQGSRSAGDPRGSHAGILLASRGLTCGADAYERTRIANGN